MFYFIIYIQLRVYNCDFLIKGLVIVNSSFHFQMKVISDKEKNWKEEKIKEKTEKKKKNYYLYI